MKTEWSFIIYENDKAELFFSAGIHGNRGEEEEEDLRAWLPYLVKYSAD